MAGCGVGVGLGVGVGVGRGVGVGVGCGVGVGVAAPVGSNIAKTQVSHHPQRHALLSGVMVSVLFVPSTSHASSKHPKITPAVSYFTT